MLGKLTWDAIPFDQPIPLAASLVVILGLAAIALYTLLKGWWPYLWREWIVSVDHKRLGIMYTLLWETTFGRFIPGVREFSVRQYVVSIYARILGDRQYLPEQPMQLTASIIVVCAVLVVFVAAATWRLKRMNLE